MSIYRNQITYKPVADGNVVLNVSGVCFQPCRNGDLIGVMNVVEHLRQRDNNPNIKFFLADDAVRKDVHCQKFKAFLLAETDYFSPTRGAENCNATFVSVWNYRMGVGDLVKFKNTRTKQKKICVFPIFDAPYNTYRNWSLAKTQEVLDRFNAPEYAGYEKFFCSLTTPSLNYGEFKPSADFMTNVEHVMTSEYYVGGETGLTLLASILDTGPKLIYYYSRAASRDTWPFYHENGELNFY